MPGLHLEKGAVLDLEGKRFTCAGRGSGGAFMLAPHKGRGIRYLKPEALYDLLCDGRVLVVEGDEQHGEPLDEYHADLSALKSEARYQVLMRYFYMQRVDEYRKDGGSLSEKAVTALALDIHEAYVAYCRERERTPPHKPLSESVIRRWYRKWLKSGRKLISLVPDARGNSHSKLSFDQREALRKAIEEQYLDPRRLTIRQVHRLMAAKIRVENRHRQAEGRVLISAPHYNTLRAHVAEIDLFERLKRRFNPLYAQQVTRYYGITPPADRHLERVQADHTFLDVYVDLGGTVLVRPWLTLIVDVCSKAILGFWLTPEPASAESVMQALRMAIMPKNVAALGGDSAWWWPMYGLPSELVVDNGKEFHGLALEIAAAELGITLTFTPPRRPYYKSQVERKFREVNRQLLSRLSGQVFKYEPESHGFDYPHLSLGEFKTIFLQWVITLYHHTPTSSRGEYTPEQLWIDSVQRHGIPGSGFSSEFVHCCLSKTGGERALSPNGINFNNLTYNNECLSRLRNVMAPKVSKGNPKVQVKWSAADIGVIWVLDPFTKEYFSVSAKEEGANGRSHYNHRVIVREQRLRRQAQMADDAYADAELAINKKIGDFIDQKTKKNKKLGSQVGRYVEGSPTMSLSAELSATRPSDAPHDERSGLCTAHEVSHADHDVVDQSLANKSDDAIEEFNDDLEV